MLNRRNFLAGSIAIGIGSVLPTVKADWPGQPQNAVFNNYNGKWELESKYYDYPVIILQTNTDKVCVYKNDELFLHVPTVISYNDRSSILEVIQAAEVDFGGKPDVAYIVKCPNGTTGFVILEPDMSCYVGRFGEPKFKQSDLISLTYMHFGLLKDGVIERNG